MTSETPSLHASKNLNIFKTKQDIEKLKTPLRLAWKCCSALFKIGSKIFSLQWHFNNEYLNAGSLNKALVYSFRFGSEIRSPTLGFVYNNQMDDFSTPGLINVYGLEPSPKNFIKPNKRMMSSMSPTIMVDHLGNVRLILGASGGTRITTGVAQVGVCGKDRVRSGDMGRVKVRVLIRIKVRIRITVRIRSWIRIRIGIKARIIG